MNNSYLFKIFLIFFSNILLFYKLLLADDNYQKWLIKIKNEAFEQGISEKTYFESIRDLKVLNNKVLSYYNNQPEFKISFNKYYNRNISSKRISEGKKLIKKHSNILKNINNSFNIPSEVVVAIWGIETNYGTYTGGFKVLESLSTLAYASKRKKFFKKEFFNAIKIIDKELISKELLLGSWAGAMGQSQFMPSSYLNYAYDYSGDNKTDIWNTESDIFASISNYLKKHGWIKEEPWCYEINKKEFKAIKDLNLKNLDFLTILKRNILKDQTLERYKKSIVVKLKTVGLNKDKRYFIVFRNFEIIKKYNNSDFYALTVGELANKITIK